LRWDRRDEHPLLSPSSFVRYRKHLGSTPNQHPFWKRQQKTTSQVFKYRCLWKEEWFQTRTPPEEEFQLNFLPSKSNRTRSDLAGLYKPVFILKGRLTPRTMTLPA
jgi:hypothetical protein